MDSYVFVFSSFRWRSTESWDGGVPLFWGGLFRSREGCVEMGLGGGGMLLGFEKMGPGGEVARWWGVMLVVL